MSHKAGHIVIESKSAADPSLAAESSSVTSSSVALDFPAGTPIEDRIRKVAQVMRAIDRLEHDEASEG